MHLRNIEQSAALVRHGIDGLDLPTIDGHHML
jgi:hypothetical protein